MTRLITICLLCLASVTSWAGDKSMLGIDYLKMTENTLLTDIMLEIEPQLIAYYQQGEYQGSGRDLQVFAIRGTAVVLGMDKLSEDTVSLLRKVAPDAPLQFLELNKAQYPNLWNFGELERLRRVESESQQLYDALHSR